ncbi:hypothetical protein HPODL_01612 [Ogataea parapolymorpha DL-1]|uniref:Early meiotic induction protein 1 n=1 Tax=Ogataea parapolymorpha (strain ATCC 26012 / BCRC 20466 / JCM 22074 / NRRL Y-7560 / DL-1) TaxID=871575 RepID=W1Q9J8_OGAPD|nr:hypothetical protein HPODL_01612 [Ogataea parapolymorpha DL-1]ESW97515.1 hypothetical protein HPODL_01612 [Ogataea parapolymorpha DL-1]
MFWRKRAQDSSVPEQMEPTEPNGASGQDGLADLQKALADAYASKSAESSSQATERSLNSMREKASKRAESISLDKFPKEMSCLTAMDELMECMSLGGQVRNYYRYGDLSMCEKQNEKLNFCFSNSLNAGEIKEKNIQEFYKNRLVEQLKRGSSEDIWEVRER